jgi:hypothetical protein
MSELDKILPAIAAAIGSVSKLGKGDRNTHANYNFASIDKFLEMANPICAENGLIFHMQESGIEEFTRRSEKGDTPWFRMHYTITVYHVSGQSLPPVDRTVEVQRTGAQASGSAQSYALKQFMRALFMIPTGDKDDSDFREHGDGIMVRDSDAPKSKSSAQLKREGVWDAFMEALDGCQSLVEIERLRKEYREKASGQNWNLAFKNQMKEEFEKAEAQFETLAAVPPEPNILFAGE